MQKGDIMTEKNVIFITVDCLRADHLGCMGYPLKTTPHLDSLAAQGALFTEAYAVGPVTPVSFMSLMTSSYPLMYEGYTTISDQRTTLAEVLADHGYSTAAFHSNPFLSRFYRYDRGFQTFYDNIEFGTRKQNKIVTVIKKNNRIFNVLKKVYNQFKRKKQPHATADELNRKVLSWVKSCADPFFLWVHYMDVHAPYIPPDAYMAELMTAHEIEHLHELLVYRQNELSAHDVEMIISLYDAEIQYVDHAVHWLLDHIPLDNTLVIITSDHGDEFGEHGEFLHGPKLYDELLHVPLIIQGPGIPQTVVTEPVSLLDIAPTILDFLNIEPPTLFQGESLLPVTAVKRSGVISEVSHKGKKVKFDPEERLVSYRTKKWKLIYGKNSRELYDLENDPQETTNVKEQYSKKVEEFTSIILNHIATEDTAQKTSREEMKIKVGIEKLKSLDNP